MLCLKINICPRYFVTDTHSISDADFMAGNYQFSRNGASGTIENDGNLTASLGGYIALLAPEVINKGVIIAQMGTVALAAGETYSLQFQGNNTLANIVVSPATIATLVQNGNAVKAPGGLIILSAQAVNSIQGSVVNNSGTLEAGGISTQGGRIILDAGSNGSNEIGGAVDVSSTGANGGQVVATGQQVQVTDGARIDATGATGGGTINVGGGWQGGGGIAQATTVYVAPRATLDASASNTGNGGTVVVRSDVNNPNSTAQVYGTLLAQGGVNGGNGGNIETSGHWLDVAGITVRTSASNGKVGHWLLDPADITISTGADANYANVSSTYTPTSGSSTSTINISTLDSALTAGNNITITTTNTGTAGSGTGNMTVSNAIASTGTSAGSLSLIADGSIFLNAGISLSGTGQGLLLKAAAGITQGSSTTIQTNGGNITFNSNSSGSGGGIVIGSGASILSNGGNIALGGGTTGDGSGYAQGKTTVSFNNNFESGILIEGSYTGTPNVTINSIVGGGATGTGGNITIYGQTPTAVISGDNVQGVTIYGSTITSGSGSITVKGLGQATSGAPSAVQSIEFGNTTFNSTTGAIIELSINHDITRA